MLSSSRAQLQLDGKPTHMAIRQYSECMMAEAESRMLMQGTRRYGDAAGVRVQQMETPKTGTTMSDGKSKGGKQILSPGTRKGDGGTKPCRCFASEAGCRLGKACGYAHDISPVTDGKPRCWNCGSTQHRKAPVKHKESRSPGKGEPGSGSGG